ncbi:MAG: 2-succinyl-5-enolpyruvyl-6-hydroxy-3-cyclohexene-1-carboxylic-acid synthase [Chloroflexi bacterium]|nr:2-succinyl-5-enolpyruvyl-6-hydroxy-3-cyclohexene-1-carboxylic-acid synthase [Chloroflexota bacterium]
MPNPNTLYANTFIDALVAAGLKYVCLTPGSRHTPLVLALARHRDAIGIFSHLDERCAAFFALGLALGANEPAAVVGTSGSAGANFFPAIIEAHQARVPLIVLTADRPHELRASGANQTIDQVKIYGDYVEWFYDAPLPEAEAPALTLRNLRTLAARVVAVASRHRGVVHVNLPYRKPLEPGAGEADALQIDRRVPTRFIDSESGARASALRSLLTDDLRRRRGLVYCGHGSCRSEAERERILPWAARLSAATGFPLFAEFTSNLRGADAIGAYESLLTAEAIDLSQVEVLIRFGSPPLSKAMQDFLNGASLRYHIYCSRAGEWADDSHSVTHNLTLNPAALDASEWDGLAPISSSRQAWSAQLARADQAARQVIAREIETGAYFDGAALHDVIDLMPDRATLFAGNSLPVRHLDQFGLRRRNSILAFANRGASGIDGNVSTALGIGAARRDSPLVAVLGDITLYHDLNGLLAIKRCGLPMTIVLLNNEGGGIFQRLPIREFEPHFSDFFITAHGLNFERAAALYGLEYVRADDRASFRRAFSASVGGPEATLIEVRTDARADLRRRAEIMAAVQRELESTDF